MVDVALKDERKDAIEEEIGDHACQQRQQAEPGMGIKSDRQLEVCDENTNTIDLHTSSPKSDRFAVGLHRFWLIQTEENDEENNESMPESIENPLHE